MTFINMRIDQWLINETEKRADIDLKIKQRDHFDDRFQDSSSSLCIKQLLMEESIQLGITELVTKSVLKIETKTYH